MHGGPVHAMPNGPEKAPAVRQGQVQAFFLDGKMFLDLKIIYYYYSPTTCSSHPFPFLSLLFISTLSSPGNSSDAPLRPVGSDCWCSTALVEAGRLCGSVLRLGHAPSETTTDTFLTATAQKPHAVNRSILNCSTEFIVGRGAEGKQYSHQNLPKTREESVSAARISSSASHMLSVEIRLSYLELGSLFRAC